MTWPPIGGARRGRLIISGAGEPAENMAIDAAILACARPEHGPTLRFYSWSVPTLSLGYFQSLDQRSLHAESLPLPVVRRATGGGAIVHDHELTYSVIIPTAGRSPGAAAGFYRAVHDAFSACLADFGIRATRFADSGVATPVEEPFLCFQRRTDEDLVMNRYKVLGSAQRRGRDVLLQHGSLLLAASPAAPQLPGIAELSGQRIQEGEIFHLLAEKLGVIFDVQWTRGELSANERAAAVNAATNKFACAGWTRRRRPLN